LTLSKNVTVSLKKNHFVITSYSYVTSIEYYGIAWCHHFASGSLGIISDTWYCS